MFTIININFGVLMHQPSALFGICAGNLGYVQEIWGMCRKSGICAGNLGHVQEIWDVCSIFGMHYGKSEMCCRKFEMYAIYWDMLQKSDVL